MAILGRFNKQPGEVIDYPVDFTDWFAKRTGDSIASHTVTAESGIDIVSHDRTGLVITVVLSGGSNGVIYKITVRITTIRTLVKEIEFTVKVKEV